MNASSPDINSLLGNLTQADAYQLILNDSSLQALYCAADAVSVCGGLCGNGDITGIGVRFAFYAQAVFNVVLVFHSPDDSTAGQWAAVVLTLALLVPAIIQKAQGNLTLFHATLVLNFATLSTLASLAVAPRCTVWRATDAGDGPRTEKRGRVVLSLALIIQLVLQWSWAVFLFTSPYYAQPQCNASTLVLFFGVPLSISQIDPHLRSAGSPSDPSYFFIWPLWLLFSIGLTMAYFILLAVSSSSSLLPHPSRLITPWPTGIAYNTPRSRGQSRVREVSELRGVDHELEPLADGTDDAPEQRHQSRERGPQKRGEEPVSKWHSIALISHNVCALLLFTGLVIITELQHGLQPWLIPGENDVTTFGQMAAMLLATAPLWSIWMMWFRGTPEPRLEGLSLPVAQRQTWRVSIPPAPSSDSDAQSEARRSLSPPRRGRSKRVVVLSPQSTPDGPRQVDLPEVSDESDGDIDRRSAKRAGPSGTMLGEELARTSSTATHIEPIAEAATPPLLFLPEPAGEPVAIEDGEKVEDAAEEDKEGTSDVQIRVLPFEPETEQDQSQEDASFAEEEEDDDARSTTSSNHEESRISEEPPSLPGIEMAGPMPVDFFIEDVREQSNQDVENAIPLRQFRRS